MVLCIMANNLHFGSVCSKNILPEVLWFFKCSFANLSRAAMFFVERKGFVFSFQNPFLFNVF